ncbi:MULTISPECIES: hypothetical protein [Achromobacter]|uniref:Uncharacterized protein n=1 Tax=Achromobacter spanius TaxID=217203 RepID=A0ABY8GMP9_9BURK|nr:MULTISPECIES: hypothetical protein [Achromobacter]WAI84802.1 hypothetical protein N8Z00_06910 [Achromobacter spanius]WEX94885.1 hypothetical protein N3Z32_01505 [Achromobacter sp. SS2-2022]WFP05947.1 hypothetical protein P8T11_16585 [Achromobacter spanius]
MDISVQRNGTLMDSSAMLRHGGKARQASTPTRLGNRQLVPYAIGK